jgi:hypothetical protein
VHERGLPGHWQGERHLPRFVRLEHAAVCRVIART